MKKKFIFLTMMLLTFLGVNVLNAQEQEPITIGSGEVPDYDTPYDMYEGYGVAQQLFEYSEINKSGIITSLSLRFYGETNSGSLVTPISGRTYTRSMAIYLTEYDGEGGSLRAGVNLEATLEPNFDGTVTFEAGEWVSFDFTNDFEYSADKNLLLTIVDKSSAGLGSNYYWWYCDEIVEGYSIRRNKAQVTNIAGLNSEGFNVKTHRNQIQLTFEASGPKVTIEAPTDIYLDQTATLTATADGFDGDVEYSWSPAEGLNDDTSANPTFTPTSTGSFKFTCTATDANNEASASVTINVTERPALVLSVSADDTEIYSDETTRLYANVQYGSGEYTYSWSPAEGLNDDTSANPTFTPSTTGSFEFTCTATDANDNEASASASVTINVTERPESPFAGKQFRVKVAASTYHTGTFLNVSSYTMSTTNLSNVATSTIADNSMQIFTVEEADNGYYYLRTIDGNYIECGARNTYNVDCYQQSPNSPLQFDYTNATYFYMRDTKKSGDNYFKVNSDGRVYCDADIDAAAIWVLEEVIPEAPDAPTLSANAISTTAVQLSWNAVSGADTYTVYEGTNVIAEDITGTNYTHEGLTPSTTYNYTVTATNEIGTSEASNTATATTWAPAPEAAPANLQATSVTHNSVTLTWDAVDGATYYEIYKDGSHLSNSNTTTYKATGLSAETSYNFTVKAANNSGTSPESEALSVTTEQFIGRTVVFELNDYYGSGSYDSWSGNKLSVELSTGESYEYTNGGTAASEYHYLDVPYGTTVTVTYLNTGTYAYENTYYIRYSDDNSLIYQDGRAVNGGNEPTANSPFSFTVERPGPENLAIVGGEKDQLYPGETTEISWYIVGDALSYNVYVNDVKFNTEVVENSPYVLEDLPYGMNTIAVTAVFENDSESGKSNTVTVQVAGTFNLVLNVVDNESNPIAEAMVTITGYDEFDVQKNYEFTTDENGMLNETLPLPLKETLFSIEVSKAPYENGHLEVTNNSWGGYVENGSTVERNVELQLTGVNQIDTDKEYYDENEPITLMWGPVENATYNVYVNEEDTPRNAAPLTTTTYTLEDGLQYKEYGHQVYVTAVYTIGESEKGYGTQVKVNGYGTVSGTVTDGTNSIKGASIVITGQDEYYQERTFTFTTAEDGTFEGSVVFGYDYTATVSKYGYEEVTIENVEVTSESKTWDFGTITLSEVEAPEATFNDLDATINNGNVDVTWDAAYARYNVYRKDAAENYEQLGATTAKTYTDESWATLDNGEYTYGVSAFVEGGTGSIIEEHCDGDSYDAPAGWYWTENWMYYPYSNTDSHGRSFISHYWNESGRYYLVTSPVSTSNSTLTFDYLFDYYGYDGTSELEVYYATSSDGPWTNSLFYETSATKASDAWHSATIDLNDIGEGSIYLAFCHIDNGFGPLYIDDIVVTGPVATESSIVWATPLTKNDANVFTDAGEWTYATNWSNGVPASGANVFIKGDVTIASDVTVNNMTINGGSVTINEGASLTVEGTLVNEAEANLVINDGAQIFQNNEDVPATFVMNIKKWTNNNDGWQFIASPLLDASLFSHATGNYDLFKYKGNAASEWYNHKLHAADFGSTFEQGVGYLASHETANTIVMTGTLNNENIHNWYSLNYDYEGVKDVASFNLLGNPFPFNMKWSEVVPTGLVTGYAYLNENGGYETAVDGEIAVGDAFFVKANSEGAQMSYGVRGAKAEQSEYINLFATGKAGRDNVIINLAGKQEGFTKMQNFNESIATVYVAEDNTRYGIYNCNSDIEEVVVSFNAKDMGDYTIAAVAEGSFSSVVLVDLFTGIETDLLTSGYTFAAKSGDNAERFVVRFSYSQESAMDSNFVYQSGEDLIIMAEGALQIVDMLGRVVYYSEVATDVTRVNVSNFDNAAYIVRVVNGEGVKTQKVVIY